MKTLLFFLTLGLSHSMYAQCEGLNGEARIICSDRQSAPIEASAEACSINVGFSGDILESNKNWIIRELEEKNYQIVRNDRQYLNVNFFASNSDESHSPAQYIDFNILGKIESSPSRVGPRRQNLAARRALRIFPRCQQLLSILNLDPLYMSLPNVDYDVRDSMMFLNY